MKCKIRNYVFIDCLEGLKRKSLGGILNVCFDEKMYLPEVYKGLIENLLFDMRHKLIESRMIETCERRINNFLFSKRAQCQLWLEDEEFQFENFLVLNSDPNFELY